MAGAVDGAFDLAAQPVHLGLGARADVEPMFTGMDWYDGYIARHAGDGNEGRLVSLFSFAEPWTSWEMHPLGAEVVVCVAGAMTLIQETDAGERRIALTAGLAAINPPGVWHTADVDGPSTCLFITAGARTGHRPR